MPTAVLKFTPKEVSPSAKKQLELHFMQEDFESYWLSINAILDEIADDGVTGVTLPPKFNFDKKRYRVDDIPKLWWTVMAFPPKIERAMKTFWKKNPLGEVIWEW